MKTSSIGLSVLCIMGSVPVLAQDRDSIVVLEEVIVTAQKRNESVQSIPASIQAITNEKLMFSGVENIAYLEQISPSLTVNHNGGYALAYIRGIGSTNQGTGSYSSVAIYVDDVYLTRPTSALFGLDSVEQIQILKGPQGALYGRNATGGAILITTKSPKPGQEFQGKVSATAGNYDLKKYGVSLSTGLTEKLAGSIEYSDSARDGYVKSTTPGYSDLDDRDTFSVMGKLVFTPTEATTLEFSASYDESDDSNGIAFQQVDSGIADPTNPLNAAIFAPNSLAALTNPQLLGFSVAANGACQMSGGGSLLDGTCSPNELFGFLADPNNLPTVSALNAAASGISFDNRSDINPNVTSSAFGSGVTAPFTGAESYGRKGIFNYLEDSRYSLNITSEYEFFDLVSVTAYTESLLNSAADVLSAMPGSVAYNPASGNIGFSTWFDSKSWSEEIRLVSKDMSFDWLAGLTYFHDEGMAKINADVLGDSLRQADNKFEVDSLAAFGQIKYPLSDKANMTLGARYTHEEFELVDHIDQAVADGIALPGLRSVQFFNSLTPGLFPTTDSYENLTGNIALDYMLDDVLFYGSVGTGFKSGNLNAQNPLSGGVDPEKITSYELGFKSDLFGNRIRLNGASFFYQYDNIHIQVINSNSGATILLNGSNAEVFGAELELVAALTEGLTLNTGLTVLNAEYKDDVNILGQSTLSINGNKIAGAPESSLTVGLEYVYPLDKLDMNGDLIFNLNALFNSGYYFESENRVGTGGNNNEGYNIYNANLTYQSEAWSVSLWANNLTDEEYYRGGLLANGLSEVAIAAAPRHYGLSVSYNFGL